MTESVDEFQGFFFLVTGETDDYNGYELSVVKERIMT